MNKQEHTPLSTTGLLCDSLSQSLISKLSTPQQAFLQGLYFAEKYAGAHPVFWKIADQHIALTSATAKLIGHSGQHTIPWGPLFRKFGRTSLKILRQKIDGALQNGQPFVFEFTLNAPTENQLWLRFGGTVLYDNQQQMIGIAGILTDISDERNAQADMFESQPHIQDVLNTIPQKIWLADADGKPIFFNKKWYDYTGAPDYGEERYNWVGLIHEDDRSGLIQQWFGSIDESDGYMLQFRLRRRDGAYRWMIARSQPYRDEKGAVLRWFGTCTDIHELKQAELNQELVSQELAHRIKNIFTVVISLIQLSARSTTHAADLADDMVGRIHALSKAYQHITPCSGRHIGPSLQGLMTSLFEAYDSPSRRRILMQGIDTPIGRTTATSLALVLHELATNAIKYGSLSFASGQVNIDIRRVSQSVVIEWHEENGPTIQGEPVHTGFGTRMSERAAQLQLGARIDRQWDDSGLKVTITIDEANLSR